jgi:DNA (cytosine-5)-methyltransferase 1
MPKKTLNFLDLFSGCGGISLGLEKAGLNCLLGLDFLEPAIQTFKLNHKNSIGICADIQKTKTSEIKKLIKNQRVDLICGGPPCQGFSTVGLGQADDKRNHLFLDFVRFVRDFKPSYIMIENVTGLLAKKNENTLQSIYKEFQKLGYHLDIRVLTASHFGVPEVRRRVIILGNNLGCQNFYPDKEFSNYGERAKGLKSVRNVEWAFNNLIAYRGQALNHDIDSAQIKKEIDKKRIKYIPEGKYIRYERDEKEFLPKNLWFDHDWGSIGEGRFREAKYQRLDRKKPSPTILTSRSIYYHPTEDRYLTVREAAALQSFPAKFEFCGSLASQWTQVGNAVPPIMAMKIGEAILKTEANKKIKYKDAPLFDFESIRKYAFKYDKDTHDHSIEAIEQLALAI